MVQPTRNRDGDLLQSTLFLVSDLVAIESAFLLTYAIRFLTGWLPTPLGVPPFAPYFYTSIVMLIVFARILHAQGLYDPMRRKRVIEDFAGLTHAVIQGSLVVLAMAFFVRGLSYSRTFFALFFVFTLCFLFAGRLGARWWLRKSLKRGIGVVRALLLGDTQMKERLLDTFHSLPGLGMVAVGMVHFDEEQITGGEELVGGHTLPVLGPLSELERVVEEHKIDAVFLTLSFERLALVTEIAERLGPSHVDVQFIPDMERIHASRMRLKEVAGVPFIGIREGGLSGIDRIVKRSIDIVSSTIGLVLLAPLLLLIAIMVKLGSRGPILYRQERLGRNHEPFEMLKFRSMKLDAESGSGPVFTSEEDPRRTAIGSFLRRFSLDELPQLWNVLRGDMSLVGPRPEREHFAEQFQRKIPRYLERHRVRSGLTGWAQVHGLRGNTPVELRTLYDLHYVEHWSLGLDLRILLRTVAHVLRGDNAY